MVEHLPLTGCRVLEFSHAVMGPVAGLVLADLGAEVIRIEPAPHGDDTRRLTGFGSGFYTFFNRNKKSVAVDLKKEQGQAIIQGLLATADVLVENFGPETMERLGLGYEELSARHPGLIYCRLKGFMQGPYEHRAALDEVVQMMSGLAYMTGQPGRPSRVGASIVDITGGTYGALGVIVALRERDQTGRGTLIENGLFETAAFIMGQHMAYAAISQEPVPPMAARVSPWSVYRIFTTQDEQQVFIGITSDKHWRSFCRAFDRRDLLADEGLATNNRRLKAQQRLMPQLEQMLGRMPLAEIVNRCERATIPFAPVARPEALFEDPQLNAGGLLESRLPDGRQAKLPRLPLSVGGHRPLLRMDPPVVGQHTRALLSELGYGQEQVDAWHEEGIVVAPGGKSSG